MNLPLYCFGSLMDRDVLGCVVGEASASELVIERAWLNGYRKVQLPHESYPMLIPDPEACSDGVLITGLDRKQLDRIVFFEGEEYELTPCQVKTDSRRTREALFFDEGIMPPPQSSAWDFQFWQQHYKDRLIRQSRAYMAYYGMMSAAEADVYWQSYTD